MDIIEEEVKTKRCSKCGRILPLSEFYKDKRANDGLRSACKACSRAKVAQYYQSNKDAILKKKAELYATHKDAILKKAADYYQENKEAITQKKAKYYQSNKDAILKKIHAYYSAHKDAILKKKAAYKQANKCKIAEYNAIYYNPILSPLGWAKHIVAQYRKMDRDRGFDDSKTITAEWFVQNIMYKPCAHCGLLQVGAIGANRLNNNIGHEASNLEPCCRNCNSRLGVIDQIERGVHISQLRKKQSFKEFVNAHKAKDKNSQ